MSIETELHTRSKSKCELCGATNDLGIYDIPPQPDGSADQALMICSTCNAQINGQDKLNPNHWRCLNDSMWSQIPAVQIMAWRMLTRLSAEGWPQDLLDMLYLEDDTLAWAQAATDNITEETPIVHKDSNGAVLMAGDTVTLTKDLNVKGANFTAKRGTAVRGISLVADNAEHIEGKINGQQIVILTKFAKKST